MDQHTQQIEAYGVQQFCYAHNLGRATFYSLVKQGRGPRLMKIGRRTLISREAAEEWRRQMEIEASDN